MITNKYFLTIGAFTLFGASFAIGQTTTFSSVSAANYRPIVAPDSIVAGWGSNLAATATAANVTNQGATVTLPSSLGNVRLSLTDSAKATLTPSLYMVSPGQINYVLPAATVLGAGTVSVQSASTTAQGPILVSNVSPGIFTLDASGAGVPAAQVLRVSAAGQVSYESPAEAGGSTYTPGPINLPSSDQVYLVLYGTGIRRRSSNPVIATVGGVNVPVLYAGAQNQYPGLDQVNLGPMPNTLVGKGTVDLLVTVDGVPANTVQIAFR